MMVKVLESLLAVLPHEEVHGCPVEAINSITQHSKTVVPGALFIALSGSHHDEDDFILSALDRGAVAIVVDREESIVEEWIHKVPFILVDDARDALSLIAAWFYDYPARKLDMVGITGSNGTSVAFMTCHLLRSMGRKVGMIGMIRYEIGSRQIPAQRKTPDAIELQRLLHEMTRAGCCACVMEVSSRAIDQKRVNGIPFRIMVFTNLTRDHLDYHQDLETCFETKRMLMDGTLGVASSALRVINVDDAYGRRLQVALQGRRVCTFGLESAFHPDIFASDMDLASGYTRFALRGIFNDPTTCLVPLIGRHNISNIQASAAIAREFGMKSGAFKAALSTMPAVPGRLEPVHCGQPFSLFIDYAHTEDSLYHVLATTKPLVKHRLHCVFGCEGSRDEGKRHEMGRVSAQWADLTWITSDNPRQEAPEQIAHDIETGYLSIRSDGAKVLIDRCEAIETALKEARAGDIVVIAGKGHERYQEFAHTVVPFDDKETAIEALNAMGYGSPESIEERRAS